MSKISVYQIITNKIIEKLEQGVVPWRKPWVNGQAVNWVTQKPYRGINALIVEPGEYATKKQILAAGGRIKKEEMRKSQIIVYWLWKEIKSEGGEGKEGEETKKFAKPLYYQVWNIKTQVDGLESKRTAQTFEHDPIEEAEEIYKGFVGPSYTFQSGQATYTPFTDVINVPPIKDFPNCNEYYSTLFHEMAHSTGHRERLNRQGITSTVAFGDETYSKEELVAEMCAAMLCGVAGIDNSTIDNSAAYIKGWMSKIKDDPKLILTASSQAQKASDYILGVTFEK